MTLTVPLTVRVGDRHVTRQLQSLSFRKEAVGGCRSISFSLARSLTDLAGLDPLAKVAVFDSRTATPVVDGRLADTGRGATPDGPQWDCVAFGPAQHASDITSPKIFIDRNLGDGWRHVDIVHPEATIGSSTKPDAGAGAPSGVLANFPNAIQISALSRVVYRYDQIWRGLGRVAYFGADWVTGLTSTDWLVQVVTDNDGGLFSLRGSAAANVAGGNFSLQLATYNHNTLAVRFLWNGAATATDFDNTWAFWENVVVEAVRKTKAGVDVTTGYSGATTCNTIVEDLLGAGWLPEFDGANARVDFTSASFDHLAYPTGVTAAQILEDLMKIEPAFRWTTTPDVTGNGYGFSWAPWPIQVRYEATLDDGGSFPLSTQSVYNAVVVRWTDTLGNARTYYITAPCAILDEQGITRVAQIDLGSEAGSDLSAAQAGNAFLAEHNVPKNAGTLTVARPIRDVMTGAMVQPWEIEPGELVRILGVEAYPDAFNTTTNDGQGVFRIHAVEYTSEGNAATLALDSDPRETADALVKLLNQRDRR